MDKKTLWIIVVVAAILAGFWLWQSGVKEGPETQVLPTPEVSKQDTTIQIQQDLEQIDLGDLDKEFESIDADLNNL